MRVEKRAPHKNGAQIEDLPRPLRAIGILPSVATLGNLLCGFFAVFCCLLAIRDHYSAHLTPTRPMPAMFLEYFPTWLALGAYLIVAAMICDALDGRLARMARRVTEFGAQLDSIADIVSFGAAPAMLFLAILLPLARPTSGEPVISPLEWRIGLLAALIYLSCAAIRLARYNAENTKDESAQQRFSGLPSPGAGAGLIALVVLHEYWRESPWAPQIRWVLIGATAMLGLLMVSRFDYLHMFNVYVRREHPPTHLLWIFLALGLGWYRPELLLVLAAYGYIISGLVLHFFRRRPAPAEPLAAEADTETELR